MSRTGVTGPPGRTIPWIQAARERVKAQTEQDRADRAGR